MTTQVQAAAAEPWRSKIQTHRLGMGWHYLWRYDPPLEHLIKADDGSPCVWREDGETSEGCIMWLADQFARSHLGITARHIYRQAYAHADGAEFDDEWLATEVLQDEWAAYTVLPKKWTPVAVRKLFEDLEDVNYHSFLAELIELVEECLPQLARRLRGWCKPKAGASAH
jgi:hypothetical protein